MELLCIDCKGAKNQQDSRHWTTSCDKWKSLKLQERKKLVKCERHIQAGVAHDSRKCQYDKMSKWYNNGVFGKDCGICGSSHHCAELCEQNRAITKLHKTASLSSCTDRLPVLLQASYVMCPGNFKLGALWDLCSTDDYITFKKAEEMQLDGWDVVLTIEGVGGVETTLDTKLHDVPDYFKKKRQKSVCDFPVLRFGSNC